MIFNCFFVFREFKKVIKLQGVAEFYFEWLIMVNFTIYTTLLPFFHFDFQTFSAFETWRETTMGRLGGCMVPWLGCQYILSGDYYNVQTKI